MENYFIFLSFIFGAIIGSFLNVVILRLPKEQSLNGRSYCPSCRHNLTFVDLVPLLSYLFLQGKCRQCGNKISPRYLIIEFVTALLFALSCFIISPSGFLGFLLLVKYVFIISVLLVVFVIDLEHYLILDVVIFPSIALVSFINLIFSLTGHNILHGDFITGLEAAILAALPFFLVWYFSKGKWMGFGDVKLALFLGAALGLPKVFVGLMLAILLGGAFSVVLLTTTSKTLKSKVPFGTFLALGSVLALFYGQSLLIWYLSILGF